MTRRVLIAVTHLLGSGHLVRMRHLAQALAEAGFAVTLASGGMALPGPAVLPYEVVQLPPVMVEGVDFRNLLDEAGLPVTPERRAARIARLRGLAEALRPAIVIVEHFPFGRRQLAEEFLALIAAARAADPACRVFASVRDVLVTPRPARIAEAEGRLDTLFDGVLVHGDADFLPLDVSWPVSPALRGKLHYTGYIAPASVAAAPLPPSGEVLVSGGGSAAALPLFVLALAASRIVADRPWRILVGHGVAEADFSALATAAPAHVIVERARPDFPALMRAAAVTVSQAGYNTVLDIVAAGRPAIVVPFDEGAETEQTQRAAAMERAGLARALRLSGQEPATAADLAAAVAQGLTVPVPALRLDRDGARRSAAILARAVAGMPAV